MGPHYIGEGLVIRYQGRVLEYRQQSSSAIYFEDVETGDIEPFPEIDFQDLYQRRELEILEAFSSPKELGFNPSGEKLPIPIDAKYEQDHLRKLDYVRGIQRRGITRGQIDLIEEAIPEIAAGISDAEPPKAMTVSAWIKRMEREHGDIYVLLSGHATGKGRQRQDPEHEALIDRIIDDEYLVRNALHITRIWTDKYLSALKELNARRVEIGLAPLNPISERSFYRRIDRLDKHDVAVAKLGREEARRAFRMVKGHLPAARPLEYVEIDHAQLDLWVLDDVLMLPLGRPWITVLRDRYSGMIVGLYISFRSPSLASTFGALRHSMYPHHGLNRTFPDLAHEWVSFGPADTYVMDRGPDFLSPRCRYAIRQLGAEYEYTERRTPWHKPNIERVFLKLHDDLLEGVPGKVYPGLGYSKDYNPQRDAVVRFSALVYLVVKWAVDYLPFDRIRAKRARPIDLWMDGSADAPILLPPDLDSLGIITGLKETATLGHEGIRFKHLSYADDVLELYYRKVGRQPGTEYVVREENLGRIHVNNTREQRWMEVTCTRPDYAEGLSLSQHQFLIRQCQEKLNRHDAVDQLARAREQFSLTVAEELDRKSNAGKIKIARYLGIDSTAVMAGRAKSVVDIARPQSASKADTKDAEQPTAGRVVISDAAFTDIPVFDWKAA